MTIDIDRLNAACMAAFKEKDGIVLHLTSGDVTVDGIYTEIPDDTVFSGSESMRTIYRLEVMPDVAALLVKGDQLTVKGQRFAFADATPNNGMMLCELRRL